MAKSANAFATTQAKVNREELADVVDIVQRSDTPIYSMIGTSKAKTVFPEWPVTAFDAPGENINSEGRDFTFDDMDPAGRLGNHTQIMEKTGKVTASQEKTDNAAQAEKLKREKYRKGLALRTDVEFSLVDSKASLGGEDRQSGSLVTFAETNVSRGAGGVNGGYDETTKVTTAPTNGTQRAFTQTLLDDLLQSAFSSGAKLSHMFLSPYAKRVFAGFMSSPTVAPFRYAAKDGKNTLVADAEVYLGPLGKVFAHPNFVMGANAQTARNVIILDTTKVSWKWFRKIHSVKGLAKTGDFDNFVLQGEGTACVENEKAVGVIADVFGLTSSS